MMTELFQNKFRIDLARCPGWDFASPGICFTTICIQNHHSYFGKIVNDDRCINPTGEIVQEEVLKTSKIRPYVLVDSYVIMPNHDHLIICIQKHNDVETPWRGVSTEIPNRWKPAQ